MHFNPIAIIIGLAATLGVAVPLDSSATHDLVSPAVERWKLAGVGAVTFHNDQPINLKTMFPAALEECLAPNHNLTWSNGPVHYDATQNRTGYQLQGTTVNRICRQGGRPKMSSSKSFMKFERYTYRKMRQCGGVDTEPLEHFFWKVNHRCHKIWQKDVYHTLSTDEMAEADFAAEADHAERTEVAARLTSKAGLNLMSDDKKINTSMFPAAVQGCILSKNGIDKMDKYDQRNLRLFDLEHNTIKKICGRRHIRTLRSRFARFEQFTFSKIKQCGDVDMEPLEHFFWQVNHRCHERWSEPKHAFAGAESEADEAVDAAEAAEEAEFAAEEASLEAEDADVAAEGAEADDSDMSDDEDMID